MSIAHDLSNPGKPATGPLVSLIMANNCGAAYLPQTIASVQAQTYRNWELLVCDDASSDDSVAIVLAAAVRDPRIRLLASATNTGPSGARNRGLDAARGDWVAIVDSDDLMHPRRIEALVEAAGHYAADLVADDLVHFGDTPDVAGRTLLQPLQLTAPILVDADILLASEDRATGVPSLGYLKPMIRRASIGELRYDPGLTIGEDFDFLLRLLLQNLWLLILPEGFYLYRRHARSLSHRHSASALQALLAAQVRLQASLGALQSRELASRLARRQQALEAGLRFETLVQSLKDRRSGAAVAQMLRDPALVKGLFRSVIERVQRRVSRRSVQGEKPALTLVLAAGGEATEALADAGAGALRLEVPSRRGLQSRFSRAPADFYARLSALSARYRLTVLAFGAAGAEAAGFVPGCTECQLLPTHSPQGERWPQSSGASLSHPPTAPRLAEVV